MIEIDGTYYHDLPATGEVFRRVYYTCPHCSKRHRADRVNMTNGAPGFIVVTTTCGNEVLVVPHRK